MNETHLTHIQLLLDAADKRQTTNKLNEYRALTGNDRVVWLIGTHEWGNIGDLAINYCEQVFLENLFPSHQVITVSRSEFTYNWQRYVNLVHPNSPVFLHGGGNFGDIWVHEELFR